MTKQSLFIIGNGKRANRSVRCQIMGLHERADLVRTVFIRSPVFVIVIAGQILTSQC